MTVVVGWDIGGVHLKAARAENGRIVKAAQYASPLRGGTERLKDAFARAVADMGAAERHAITMTGELADTFTSRADGVEQLVKLAQMTLGEVSIYAGPLGFVGPEQVRRQWSAVASANWHAAAAAVARQRADALLADVGSTTTDIIPVTGGKVAARGFTDAERLAAGELVYTGLVRGFVMAAADRAPFGGAWTPLVNENFATMADVHRILGTLPDDADLMATADGRDKSIEASRARLARMIGCDAGERSDATWAKLAQWFAEAQCRTIADAAMLTMSRTDLPPHAPIVAAGIGLGLIAEVARRLGCVCVRFDELFDVATDARSAIRQCAPAAALAMLAS